MDIIVKIFEFLGSITNEIPAFLSFVSKNIYKVERPIIDEI